LCYEVLSPLKIHRPQPGLNPQTLGPVASTLPLDHRGRLSNMIKMQNIYSQIFGTKSVLLTAMGFLIESSKAEYHEMQKQVLCCNEKICNVNIN
jgi:hypothetical protein